MNPFKYSSYNKSSCCHPYNKKINPIKDEFNNKIIKLLFRSYPKHNFNNWKVLVFDGKDRKTCKYLLNNGFIKNNITIIEKNEETYNEHIKDGYKCYLGYALSIINSDIFSIQFNLLVLDMNGAHKKNFNIVKILIQKNLIADINFIPLTLSRRTPGNKFSKQFT